MARYNTSQTATTTSGATTISAPAQGYIQSLTGAAPFTVAIPDPRLYPGIEQVYYNNTTGSGVVTLATASGLFVGGGASGTSTQTFNTGSTITIVSDGTNYIIVNEDGGALAATTGTFSGTLTANSTVNLSPANFNVTISPTGNGIVTINPASAGAINNVSIGVTTPLAGSFTTLGATGQVTFNSTVAIPSTTTGTGSLVITNGGLGVSGQVTASTVSATTLIGTLNSASAAQTNITSVGTLTSLTVGTSFTLNSSGQFTNAPVPNSSGGQTLGTASLRWGTIYTNDLALSNGIGDYTIVEGAEDLFLYNNKNGKVYKFLTQEVDPSTAPPKGVQF